MTWRITPAGMFSSFMVFAMNTVFTVAYVQAFVFDTMLGFVQMEDVVSWYGAVP